MKKNKFKVNLSYLITSGLIVRFLGLVNKIFLIRILGIEGMKLHSLVMPTMLLFIALAELGMPQAIAKVISERVVNQPYSNRKIIIKAIKNVLFFSIILILAFLIILKPMCNDWLKCNDLYYPMLTIIPLIPLVALTGVLKGYLNGHKQMNVTANATLIEQLIRISSSILIIIMLNGFGIVFTVCLSLLTISLGEFVSLIFMTYKIKKLTSLKLVNTKKTSFKAVYEIAIPGTLSRITYSAGNFIEPIIFTASLSQIGLASTVIQNVYASINGYAIPLLILMSFISYSISVAILPLLSETNANSDIKRFNEIIKIAILITSIFIFFGLTILFFYKNEIMLLLYGSNIGAKYINIMAPFFIFYYIENILHVALEVIGLAKDVFLVNLFLSIIKLIIIFILGSSANFNIWSLPIAIIFNILLTFTTYYIMLYNKTKCTFNLKNIFKILISLLPVLIIFYFVKLNYIYCIAFSIILYFSLICFFFKKDDFSTLLDA